MAVPAADGLGAEPAFPMGRLWVPWGGLVQISFIKVTFFQCVKRMKSSCVWKHVVVKRPPLGFGPLWRLELLPWAQGLLAWGPGASVRVAEARCPERVRAPSAATLACA